MIKLKKKLTSEGRLARKKYKKSAQNEYKWIFINGKQVRVKKQSTIDGVPVDEYIERNADPLWFQQNEIYIFRLIFTSSY